jgi:iron complex transport system substrate-binding protein
VRSPAGGAPAAAAHLERPAAGARPGGGGPGGDGAAPESGSSLYALDERRLAALAPDLLFTQSLCPVCAVSGAQVGDAIAGLAACPRVVSLDPHRLAEVFADVARVGREIGREAAAARLVADLERRLEAVRRSVATRARPRVAALEWLDPPFVAGHWVPEMIAAAGGDDALATPGDPSRRAGWEEIAAADPDVVVAMPCGFDAAGSRLQVEALAGRAEWTGLRAVRERAVVAVDANGCFSRPGPRLVDGIEALAEAFAAVYRRPSQARI